MKKLIMILCFAGAAWLIAGCGRTLNTSVEFKGNVYYGYEPEGSDGKIAVLGPLARAKVSVRGQEEYAVTDSMGRYTLSIKTHRKFETAGYDTYILEASGTSSPSIYPQAQYLGEVITVHGRPGDTIQVRDFILMSHKIEEEGK